MIEVRDIIITNGIKYEVIILDDINYYVKHINSNNIYHFNRIRLDMLFLKSPNWKHISMYKKRQFEQQLDKIIHEN